MIESLVIIPTYNEKETFKRLLKLFFNLLNTFHVLLLMTTHQDAISDLVAILCLSFGAITFGSAARKMGLGTAYIHGFKWALERNYQYIFEMDVDFSHNPDYSDCSMFVKWWVPM